LELRSDVVHQPRKKVGSEADGVERVDAQTKGPPREHAAIRKPPIKPAQAEVQTNRPVDAPLWITIGVVLGLVIAAIALFIGASRTP
jgi:hypothetical protein